MSSREAIHRNPIWREKSDFIVAAHIDPGDTDVATEQLWARRIDGQRFELCCIPFFTYNLALGDIFTTDSDYMVKEVVHRSGRHVFRVRLLDVESSATMAEDLANIGALVEWSSPSLLALDARDRALAQMLKEYLRDQADANRLIYENGLATRN